MPLTFSYLVLNLLLSMYIDKEKILLMEPKILVNEA